MKPTVAQRWGKCKVWQDTAQEAAFLLLLLLLLLLPHPASSYTISYCPDLLAPSSALGKWAQALWCGIGVLEGKQSGSPGLQSNLDFQALPLSPTLYSSEQ